MTPRMDLRIRHPITLLLSATILAACSQGSHTDTTPQAPKEAAPPVAVSTPLPTATPTPVSKPTRIIPSENVTGTYCLVRKAPDGTGGVAELRLPIASVKADEWATNVNRDIPLTVYTPMTYCNPGNFSGDSFTLRIEKSSAGDFDVSVRHKADPKNPVLSQVFKLSPNGQYLHAQADGCMPVGGSCGAYDGLDAYLYMADVRNGDGDLAKLVMLDLFAVTETPECKQEKPSSTGTVVNNDGTCPVPTWVYDTFGPPDQPKWRVAPLHSVGKRQTGSGGGYEPPP